VYVVCCQVEVSETGWSLVQRSPTDCGVCLNECDHGTSRTRRPKPTTWLFRHTQNKTYSLKWQVDLINWKWFGS
jgi:hypothetical protein